MEKIPDGGFTMDYVLNHMGEANDLFNMLRDVVTSSKFDGEKYADSLEEAIGKE